MNSTSPGMSEYTERFVESRIDISVLPDLTEQHLKDLGIPLGDSLKMLRAIRDLGNASAAVTAPVAAEPVKRMSMMRSARFAPLAIVYLNNVSALLNVCSTPHASGMPTNPQASASCSTVVPPSC